jgi:hypothetical protein
MENLKKFLEKRKLFEKYPELSNSILNEFQDFTIEELLELSVQDFEHIGNENIEDFFKMLHYEDDNDLIEENKEPIEISQTSTSIIEEEKNEIQKIREKLLEINSYEIFKLFFIDFPFENLVTIYNEIMTRTDKKDYLKYLSTLKLFEKLLKKEEQLLKQDYLIFVKILLDNLIDEITLNFFIQHEILDLLLFALKFKIPYDFEHIKKLSSSHLTTEDKSSFNYHEYIDNKSFPLITVNDYCQVINYLEARNLNFLHEDYEVLQIIKRIIKENKPDFDFSCVEEKISKRILEIMNQDTVASSIIKTIELNNSNKNFDPETKKLLAIK